MSGMVTDMREVIDHGLTRYGWDVGQDPSSQPGADGDPADRSDQETACVRATYDTGEVHFSLQKSATLAQLIEKLAVFGRGHGSLVSVELLIEPAVLS